MVQNSAKVERIHLLEWVNNKLHTKTQQYVCVGMERTGVARLPKTPVRQH